MIVISPTADMHGAPDAAALRGKHESQLVFGEEFIVEETTDGWCRGHSAHDGYKGYVEARHLADAAPPATHIVTAVRSHCYRDATMKSPQTRTLSFGSRVTLAGIGEKFVQMSGGDWIYAAHVAPVGQEMPDIVDTARRFLETPYYWGGRSGFGIDCSGLAQVVLARAGIHAPRDTEEQQNIVGTPREGRPRRADLVYFKGHVGIMTDDDTLLHANAHHMKVCEEPLWQVVARAGDITAVRKL